MSAENVALIRSMHPGPDVDLAPLVGDDEATARWRESLAHVFEETVQATIGLPGMAPVTYSGLDGLREAWRDWLSHWASYRDEIEDVIDGGDRIVVVHRFRAEPRPGAPEITRRRTTVWTVRQGRVAHVDFNVPYATALSMAEPQQ